MTDLTKKVARRSMSAIPAIRRRVIVALMPGDVIAFREEGRRKWYTAPIGRVFVQVAHWNTEATLAERKRIRKEKRRTP